MSYLDPPRMHFFGTFTADPPTINNATENYNPDEVYNNQPPSDVNPNSVWWNQMGQGFFKVPSCAIQSARDASGREILTPADDPIVGASLISVPSGTPIPQYARLVDLDPDQQARSMIVALTLQLTIPSESGVSLTGTARPMCILDLWGRVKGGNGGGIFSAGCVYQSILEDLQWQGIDQTRSNVLKQLQARSPRRLSFKMVVDAYDGNLTSATFSQGRMVGTIGPYVEGEPAHFLAQRRMYPGGKSAMGKNSPMNVAPFQITNGKLIIDLGNSVPTTRILAGPFEDLGAVRLVMDPGGLNVPWEPFFSTPEEYAAQYERSAGIFEIPMDSSTRVAFGLQIEPPNTTTSAITGLAAGRLKEGLTVAQSGAQVEKNPAGRSIALAENEDGLFIGVSENVLRLQKGALGWQAGWELGTGITADAEIEFVATRFGAPAAGVEIGLKTAMNQYQFANDKGELYEINNVPPSGIVVSFPHGTKTGSDGKVTLNFAAGSLSSSQKKERRKFVDGQLYFFTHQHTMDTQQPISLLVFEDSPPIPNPTWWRDVYPIFNQYARLYPAMRSLIDLADYATVTSGRNRGIIRTALTLPMTHPAYMPVTRDLSRRRLEMVLDWLDNGMPEGTRPADGGEL